MTTAHSKTNTHTNTVVGDSIRHAGHKVEEFSQQAADKSDQYINQGHEKVDEIQKEFERYTDSAITYIKKYPLKSALIAGGVGLILGRLLGK